MAPARLADGYARVGVFRRDGVVQVLYSDGIYELSVFERRGELDRRELGSTGGPVTVGKAAGWRYAWPGGQVVLWQAGPHGVHGGERRTPRPGAHRRPRPTGAGEAQAVGAWSACAAWPGP